MLRCTHAAAAGISKSGRQKPAVTVVLQQYGPCTRVWPARLRVARSMAHATTQKASDAESKIGISHEELEQLLQASECDISLCNSSNAQTVIPLLLDLSGNSPQRVLVLIKNHPELLNSQLEGWVDFLGAYGMTKRDIFRLMSKDTELFTQGSLYNAGQIISFLQQLGLTPRDISSTILPSCATVLRHEAENIAAVVAYLRHSLGMSDQHLIELLVKCPRVLTTDVHSHLQPRMEFLMRQGFTRAEICRAISENCCAVLLLQDVAAIMRDKAAFLTDTVGLSEQEAAAVMLQTPALLSLSTNNLRRKHRFLSKEMGLDAGDLLLYPSYFLKSLMVEIGPRFSFAKDRNMLDVLRLPGSSRVSLAGLLECNNEEFAERMHAEVDDFTEHATRWMQAEGRTWGIVVGSW